MSDTLDILERMDAGIFEYPEVWREAKAEIIRLRTALAAETERCAKVAEYQGELDWGHPAAQAAAARIAAAIREKTDE